jgi:putative flippase GtrA
MPSMPIGASAPPRLAAQLRSFVLIGIACTAAFAVLYAALRGLGLGPLAANGVALLATMGINFAANRSLTFHAGAGPLGRQLAGYATAYLLGLGASSVVLAALLEVLGHPRGLLDTAAAVAAGLAATAVRFVLMRAYVFRDHRPAVSA